MNNKLFNTVKAQKNLDELYTIIKDYIKLHDYSPSTRDILALSNLKSVSSIHGYLEELERRGLIIRDHNKSRSIRLADDASGFSLPIVGNIAAGSPILAEQNIIDIIAVPQNIAINSDFILKTKGDSMIDAGILDGDLLIVKKQNICDNGDIAAILIDDEATVKRFYKKDNKYRLVPENKNMKPMIVDECEILGKVVAVYRSL